MGKVNHREVDKSSCPQFLARYNGSSYRKEHFVLKSYILSHILKDRIENNISPIHIHPHDSDSQTHKLRSGLTGQKKASQSRPRGFSMKNVRSVKVASSLATLLFVAIPAVAYASGFFDVLSSIFSPGKVVQVKSVNSQTIALLEAPVTGSSQVNHAGDLAIVGGTSLSATSPDPVASSTPNSDQISVYVVHQGDTLSEVAAMFGVSKNTIIWANNLKNGKISPGDQLVILPISGVEYTVKSGDTVKSIATKFKGDVDDIASFNNISPTAKLAIGDTVIIPDGEMTSVSTVSSFASGSSRASNLLIPNSSSDTGDTNISPPVGSRGPNYPVYIGYYMRPLIGGIKTQGIHGHNGVDLASSYGTNIMASADGEVIVAKSGGWNGGYGSYIVISHDNGTQTLYGHLSSVNVSVGETVTQGQIIGRMGSTGESTGVHLHFEVRGARNPF
jgi:murein DD-endopeptidase MepM/ murein hydrolase activator NlpD